MNTEKQKHGEMPLRIYKPSGGAYLGVILVIITFVIALLAILSEGELGLGMMLIFVPVIGFIFWIVSVSTRNRELAIYEDGLEYRFGKSYLFSRWEDLQHFGFRSSGRSRVVGVYCASLEKHSEGMESFLLSGYYNFIPLSIVRMPTRWDGCWTGVVVDTKKLAQTEFGNDLLHYAPHLFEYGQEKVKNG